jgi:hypothetical protein
MLQKEKSFKNFNLTDSHNYLEDKEFKSIKFQLILDLLNKEDIQSLLQYFKKYKFNLN